LSQSYDHHSERLRCKNNAFLLELLIVTEIPKFNHFMNFYLDMFGYPEGAGTPADRRWPFAQPVLENIWNRQKLLGTT
jgi:hypothetical protein